MMSLLFFFFNDTATTEIYTLSLHDALPIWFVPRKGRTKLIRLSPGRGPPQSSKPAMKAGASRTVLEGPHRGTIHAYPDRKSTRLNSSHANISYAVFCLKKKKLIIYAPQSCY